MIFDQSGSLANVKRHDYLPFGEELFAPVAGRSAAQGYSSGDGLRQQFTSKERDIETGLDYFEARYYASLQGRFTSPDPFGGSARAADPQTMNRYTLVLNNPLRYVDPNGLKEQTPWEQMTEEEKKQLTPKLVRLKNPNKITQQEHKAAGARFNSLVTVKGDAQATADRIATAKSFVKEFSSHGRAPHNDPAYRQIDQIQAIGRSTLEVTVKNKDAFLKALASEGYSVNAKEESIAQERSRRLRGRADHPFDNARSLTYRDTDPELHFANDKSDNPDYGPNYFFAHWDVSSVNCLAGCGPIGRALSGPKHAEGDAKPEQVTNYYKLRPQAPKP
jgi:RHS repeat-associated protein